MDAPQAGKLGGRGPLGPHLSQQARLQELMVGLGGLLKPVVLLQIQGLVVQGKSLCFLQAKTGDIFTQHKGLSF